MRTPFLTTSYFIIFLFSLSAKAQYVAETTQTVPYVQIDKHNVCARVRNAAVSTRYFIPVSTDMEWAAFRAHLPSVVSIDACTEAGVCGGAQGQSYYNTTPPAAGDLCSKGATINYNNNGGLGPWTWGCQGVYGGADAACVANRKQDAICGTNKNTPAAPGGYTLSNPPPANATAYVEMCSLGNYQSNRSSASGVNWTWGCAGLFGGTNASCFVPIAIAGTCGTSNGNYYPSAPTTNLCASGSASASGAWNWNCLGTNGGATSACAAYQSVTPVCGSSNGQSGHTSAPSSNLCSAGSASIVTTSTTWDWTCTGAGVGTINCSAPIAYNAICGTSNGGQFVSAPSTNLCSPGTASAVTNSGTWDWTCSGVNGGSGASCLASIRIDGACGSSDGQSLPSTPTDLCSAGNASAVSGTGPWNWSCAGVNGGATNSCNASLSSGPCTGLNCLELVAGKLGGVGNVNGVGVKARFYYPTGIATDSAGNHYVSDSGAYTIRKVSASGSVSTFAGSHGQSGTTNGTGSAARFADPRGIAVDSSGNVYVADTSSYTIRKITSAGVVTTFAGSPGLSGTTNGTGTAARFTDPRWLAVDSSNNIYVSDFTMHVIRKITPAGVVTNFAGLSGTFGYADGSGTTARFINPTGITADSSGNIYVYDGNSLIRKITSAGVVSTVAGLANNLGYADGTGTGAIFSGQGQIAVDGSGNVYVGETNGYFVIRKVTPGGVVTTIAGDRMSSGYVDATGGAARFKQITGLAMDSSGNVVVVDQEAAIRKVTSAGVVSTFAGLPKVLGRVDGVGEAAQFEGIGAVLGTFSGAVYVADKDRIRKISETGDVTSFVGNFGGNWNGTGTGAALRYPTGMAMDSAGNIYVADSGNHAIRKITSGGVVTTFAGSTSGASGSTDGTGTAALFNSPNGIAIDSTGNLYVADGSNFTVRKITPAGVVTTLAGTAGGYGSTNGTGAAARFSSLFDLTVDSSGNVFVPDYGNQTIRKITPAGVVTTFAGSVGVAGTVNGTGSAARFTAPSGITIDTAGNLYVSEAVNTVRKITPAGVVTTVVGDATKIGSIEGTLPSTLASLYKLSYSNGRLFVTVNGAVMRATISTPALPPCTMDPTIADWVGWSGHLGDTNGTGAGSGGARLAYPTGVTKDSSGNVYVITGTSFQWGTRVRKITPAGTTSDFVGNPASPGGYGCVTADGTGATAAFCDIKAIATDSANNIYVLEGQHSNGTATNQLRKVTPAGVVTTINADLTPGLGVQPSGLVVDSGGNAYFYAPDLYKILKVTAGGVVSDYAGDGIGGYADGPAATARFYASLYAQLAVDSSNNIYLTDAYNGRIRKITPGGVVSTLAGGTISGAMVDGTGSAAQFYPGATTAITTGTDGNLYVLDGPYTQIQKIRKVTLAGVVTTLPYISFPANSSYFRFILPSDVDGVFYISDNSSHVIQKASSLVSCNGSCGTANGQTAPAAPTTNLCAMGTPSAVTGTGPWNWSCLRNGPSGTDASCSATPGLSSTSLNHTGGHRDFSVTWVGSPGIGSCKIQVQGFNGYAMVWQDTDATNVDCNSNVSNMQVLMPGDGWATQWSFGGWAVPVRVVKLSDSSVIHTFNETLTCNTPGSNVGGTTPTPYIDENCNGQWDDVVPVNGYITLRSALGQFPISSTLTCPNITNSIDCYSYAGPYEVTGPYGATGSAACSYTMNGVNNGYALYNQAANGYSERTYDDAGCTVPNCGPLSYTDPETGELNCINDQTPYVSSASYSMLITSNYGIDYLSSACQALSSRYLKIAHSNWRRTTCSYQGTENRYL